MIKLILKITTAVLLGFCSFYSFAQDGAQVVAVVSPAWAVQGGDRIPLKPGYQVLPTDLIETAGEGRVQFAFSNNAEFQLGEKAKFKGHRLSKPEQSDEPYDGFVEVLQSGNAVVIARLQIRSIQFIPQCGLKNPSNERTFPASGNACDTGHRA